MYVSSFCRNDVTHLNLFTCKHNTWKYKIILLYYISYTIARNTINITKYKILLNLMFFHLWIIVPWEAYLNVRNQLYKLPSMVLHV